MDDKDLLNQYDSMKRDVKIEEVDPSQISQSDTELLSQYSQYETQPPIKEESQISPLLSPVLAAPEITGQLAWGMASWLPSKITGIGTAGLLKLSNAILESEQKSKGRTPEEIKILKEIKPLSPEEIRQKAEQAEAWWQIMPEPATREAKTVLEKVGKGLDWLLSPFKVADEYYTKKGYPNLGYALRFIGEGLYFKGLHGVKTSATPKIKALRKKLIRKVSAEEISKHLEDVMKEIDITKEPPKGDELKRVTKSQKIKAHEIQRAQSLSKVEYMEIAERISGETSIKDMNKASAKEFIEELKKGKEGLEKARDIKEEVPKIEEKIVEEVKEFEPKVEPISKVKEVTDAEKVGKEAREAGERERIEREAEEQVRVRDAEKDRLEARAREAKEEVKEEEVKEEIKEIEIVDKSIKLEPKPEPPSEVVKSPAGESIIGEVPKKDRIVFPANRVAGKIYTGMPGDLHSDIALKYKHISEKEIKKFDMDDAEFKIEGGWIDNEGNFLDVEAANKFWRRGGKEKIEEISSAVKISISDDIRTAEDMGIYAEVKDMVGEGKKIGEIMKEVKQKAYYKEDLKDFGYNESDIRKSIRAIKAEFGEETSIKSIQNELKKEEMEVEKLKETKTEEVEISSDIEKVDLISGRPAGVKEDLITSPKEVDEVRMRWEQEQMPITSQGKIVKTKSIAKIMAEKQGKIGDLVKNPKGEGWLVKKTKEQRETKAKEDAKEWETILKEEELGDLGDEGLGKRVDVDIDTIFNPFGNEEGALKIFGDISNKISDVKKKMSAKKNRASLKSLFSKPDLNRIDGKNIIELGSSIIRQSNKLRDTKYSDNIKRYNDNYVVITDDGNISILGSSTLGETLSNFNHPDFDSFGYLFSKLRNDNVVSKLRKEFISGLIDEREYRRSRSVIGLSDDAKIIIDSFTDIIKGEKGAITIHRKVAKELKHFIKKGYYTRNRIIRELRKRGASDEDILKVFPDASVRILNKGKESKWWKTGQDSLELLPRRTLPNKLKAPAVTRGEAHMIATMKDMPARLTAEHLSWENAIRTFEKLPKEMKETFYRSVKEGESLAFDSLQDISKRSRKIRQSVNYLSHKRIGIHAIAQQPDGIAVLAQQGITKIPKLKPKELKAYEDLRTIYNEFFVSVNRARIAAGEKPFPPVDNYFTWIQDITYLSKTEGVGLFSNWRTIESKMAEIKKVPSFRFAKFRAGPEKLRKLNLNPFTVIDTYAKTATNYIEMAPRLAKLNELLTEKYGMAQNAPHAYNFIRHWLNYQAGKIPAWDIAHPKTRAAMRYLNSNIVYSLLAYNIRSALIQPAAMASSYAMLGEYYMGAGLSHIMSPAKWKMAGKKSKVLNTRSPETAIYEAMEASGKFPGMFRKRVAKIGMAPLTTLDSVSARITWLGAYAKGLKKFKSESKAINYADDIVTKTQASAAKSDIAPIQRTQLGKTVTCLQTFVINHWGFLTKDVMGIKNADIKNPVVAKRVIRFILATTAVNAFYEDGLGLNSPNPTPIRAYREMFEETADHKKAFARGVKEIAEYIPLWGGRLRYGSEVGGPVLSETLKLIEDGDVDALIKLMGIPGSNQFFKMVRAYERGGTDIDIILGRHVDPDKDKIRNLTAPMKGSP